MVTCVNSNLSSYNTKIRHPQAGRGAMVTCVNLKNLSAYNTQIRHPQAGRGAMLSSTLSKIDCRVTPRRAGVLSGEIPQIEQKSPPGGPGCYDSIFDKIEDTTVTPRRAGVLSTIKS